MKPIIVLTTLPFYLEVVDRIYATTTPSGVVTVDNSTVTQVLPKLTTKPFYSDFYWVLVECSQRIKEVKELQDVASLEWVKPVYLCPNKGIYNEVKDWLISKGIPYELFNCYNVGYFAKLRFVRKTFMSINDDIDAKLDSPTANYIAKRLNGYENTLEFLMSTALGRNGKITKSAMGKLMPIKKFITLGNFMTTLMTLQYGDEENIMLIRDMVERYRYYSSPLIRSIADFFKQWENLYAEFRSGEFNENTYVLWMAEKGKKLEVTSEYVAKRWLKIFNSYSYEFMLMLKLTFMRYRKMGYPECYAYIVNFVTAVISQLETDEMREISRAQFDEQDAQE